MTVNLYPTPFPTRTKGPARVDPQIQRPLTGLRVFQQRPLIRGGGDRQTDLGMRKEGRSHLKIKIYSDKIQTEGGANYKNDAN